MRTRDVVRVGMYVALFAVLEIVSNTLPLFKMPEGGSLSLGAIALVLASYDLGWKLGLMTTFISFLVMIVLPGDQLYFYNIIQFLCDYLFAYACYAFTSLIPDFKIQKTGYPIGIFITSFFRFMFHNISGWIFFAEAYKGRLILGVMGYNASYMIPTAIVTFIIVFIVKPRLIVSK
jgi:thiamine transporter